MFASWTMFSGFVVVKSLKQWWTQSPKRIYICLSEFWFQAHLTNCWSVANGNGNKVYTNKLELTKPWPQEFFARWRRSEEKKNWRRVSSKNLSVLSELRHSACFCYLQMSANRTRGGMSFHAIYRFRGLLERTKIAGRLLTMEKLFECSEAGESHTSELLENLCG